MIEIINEVLDEKNKKLRSVFPGFKSIAEKLKNAQVSPEFWKIERENIRKANEAARKEKESMKMTPEKFRQEFTI